jgi:hypothetical protein
MKLFTLIDTRYNSPAAGLERQPENNALFQRLVPLKGEERNWNWRTLRVDESVLCKDSQGDVIYRMLRVD